jgi:hypothetical protein
VCELTELLSGWSLALDALSLMPHHEILGVHGVSRDSDVGGGGGGGGGFIATDLVSSGSEEGLEVLVMLQGLLVAGGARRSVLSKLPRLETSLKEVCLCR